MVSVFIVEDHNAMRELVRIMLNATGDMELVGQASTADGLIDNLRTVKPDVVLMDIKVSRGDGIEETRKIKAAGLTSKVLIVSGFTDDEHILNAFGAGASGYLFKENLARTLIPSIRSLAEGQSQFLLDEQIGERWTPQLTHALQDTSNL